MLYFETPLFTFAGSSLLNDGGVKDREVELAFGDEEVVNVSGEDDDDDDLGNLVLIWLITGTGWIRRLVTEAKRINTSVVISVIIMKLPCWLMTVVQ